MGAQQLEQQQLHFYVGALSENKAFLIKVSPVFPRLPRIAFSTASTTPEKYFLFSLKKIAQESSTDFNCSNIITPNTIQNR